jgi:hypothetical protein
MAEKRVGGSCHGNAFGFVKLAVLLHHRMPHHVDRPTKICPVCGRPFQWRKKWKDVWDEVKYCSERCRRNRHRNCGLPDPSAGPQISSSASIAVRAAGMWSGFTRRWLAWTEESRPSVLAAQTFFWVL